jgi:hypothetical protein
MATVLLLLLGIASVLASALRFNGVKKEKIKVMKRGSLGVRLGSDFKVLEVIDSDSMLQLDDRITAIDGETITDFEFYEFKEVLASAEVPFILSIERLYLDKESVKNEKENAQFMTNNDIEGDTISPSLITLGNNLGLHLPIVSVRGGKSVDFLNFISEAAEFSGPFSCDYQTLQTASPMDGCQLAAKDKRTLIYKDSIVLVKRGICPFVAKGILI